MLLKSKILTEKKAYSNLLFIFLSFIFLKREVCEALIFSVKIFDFKSIEKSCYFFFCMKTFQNGKNPKKSFVSVLLCY